MKLFDSQATIKKEWSCVRKVLLVVITITGLIYIFLIPEEPMGFKIAVC